MIQNVEKSPKVAFVPCLSRHGCRTENDRTSFSDFQKKESEYYRGGLSPMWRQRPGDSEREDGTGHSTI